MEHVRSVKGKVSHLQDDTLKVLDEIRREVLETKGVQLARVLPEHEAYIPKPERAVVPVPVSSKAPAASPRTPVQSKALAEIDSVLEMLGSPTISQPVQAAELAEKTETVRAETEKAKGSEKEALQDILFQLEELDKVVKKPKV